MLCEPDLAGAALHLVGGGMLGFRHRGQRAAEFDDVPVAVVPIVQQRKIIPDFVDRPRVPVLNPKAIYRVTGDRKRYWFPAKMQLWHATPFREQVIRHQGVWRGRD